VTPPDRSLAPALPTSAATVSASPAPSASGADTSAAPRSTTPAIAPATRPANDAPFWERWRDRWNAFVATDGFQRWAARFPLTRPVALRRSRALFDLMAGFVYTQTLYACVELDLFELLAKGPLTAEQIGARTGLEPVATERLIRAACSLKLFARRRGGRIALGPLGAPMVGNAGLVALIRHHAMAYADLSDPVLLLRSGSDFRTELSRYWPYAEAATPQAIDETRVASYSEMMAATLPPLAADVLDAYDLSRHRCLLDVGGGEGVFLTHAGQRHPQLMLRLFDLPAVTARAAARLAREGLADRAEFVGGNFHADALPTGADIISLVRVLLDHDDASVQQLLRKAHAALPPGGTLLVAEAMSGARSAEPVGDAYFNFYLLAMGKGRARRPEELTAMIRAAGFRKTRQLPTRYPIQTGLIIAEA
jgi:demethylspheroidene O-methyltransferase